MENVRRHLQQQIVRKTVCQVEVRLPRLVRTPADAAEFGRRLEGGTIQAIGRRGKYLLIWIPPHLLVSHLRMEGQYRLCSREAPELPHTHVVFRFTDGTELRYRDVRQFGTMDLIPVPTAGPGLDWVLTACQSEAPFAAPPDELALPPGLRNLGPEPFDPQVTARVLRQRFAGRTAPVKALLLDQTVVAGLGNIYADEALFQAGLHPAWPAGHVSVRQAASLLAAVRDVLERAIAAGGSSVKTFVDGYGRHGGFQWELAVYGRSGLPCPRCASPIEKLRVAGRGTHVCPRCQPWPRRLAQAGRTVRRRRNNPGGAGMQSEGLR